MKISIVTPVLNCEKFIDETITSVIFQKGDFEIEYILVDGGSTDGTLSIIDKYIGMVYSNNFTSIFQDTRKITVINQKNTGMYDAICQGFSSASGDIFAWINADDIYLPGALNTVHLCFSYNKVFWLKGITLYTNNQTTLTKSDSKNLYDNSLIQKGYYGTLAANFIQQDSVFWRKEVWDSISSQINLSYKYAGDYQFWILMSNMYQLTQINVCLSAFRKHDEQLSGNFLKYKDEMEVICKIPLYKMLTYRVGKGILDLMPCFFSDFVYSFFITRKSINFILFSRNGSIKNLNLRRYQLIRYIRAQKLKGYYSKVLSLIKK
jgi:glycosyltransferase involved in cell wall biosynthesis